MNENTLISVHGYTGDVDRVTRHMPLYLHHERPVLILSPEDAPILRTGVPGNIGYHAVGKRAYIGQFSLDRQHEHLKVLEREPFDWFLANDSDSFCIPPRIPLYLYERPDIFWSNEVPEPRPHASPLPKLALQPPYFFHKSSLSKMLEFAPGIVMHPITQYIDHYMLQLTHAAGVRHETFRHGKNDCTVMAHPVKTLLQMDWILKEYAGEC